MWEELLYRMYTSFICEDRYLFYLQGLKMTIELTLISFILGTLFGVLFAALKQSKVKQVRKIADVIIGLLVQIPTLVLLMISVYVIFGTSGLSTLVTISIALVLKVGAYMSDIIITARNSVASGEIEAARTLGMTKAQAFRWVALPQIITNILPVYKNQFIETMHETSVVGYLALMDLTRASSVVMSRTYDAIFGLIVTTVFYLLIGYAGRMLINLLSIKKRLYVGGENK